jgi:hypothetical protein
MTTTLQQLTAAQANKEVAINRNFETLSPVGMYGYKQSTTTGLTLGYYGGHIAGSAIADGTIALDASNTVYVVAHRTTGVVSKSTATTNWDTTGTYGRLFKCTTSASAITPVDWREQAGGWFDRAAAGGATASVVTITDAGGYYTGTEVETALQEIGASLAAAVANVPAQRYTIELLNTTDSDPGAGLIKFNNATPASATELYIDDSTSDSVDLSTYFTALGATGWVKIQSALDAGEWAIFRWTAITDQTGYFKFAVTPQASKGTLDDADAVLVTFDSDANTGSGGSELKGLTFTSDTGSTADSDPGAGLFKWNNATQGSATKLFFDNATLDSITATTFFATLSTNGTLYIQQGDDATKWQLWEIDTATADAGYYDLAVTLLAKSTADIDDAKTCYCDFKKGGTGGGSTQGKHSVYIDSMSMRAQVTDGAVIQPQAAGAAGQPDHWYFEFDQTTQQYLQFRMRMPESWDEGALTYRVVWQHAATTTNFGFVAQLQAVAFSNDDALAANFGTAVNVTDTGGTTADVYITDESAAVTVGGSPQTGDLVVFRLSRLVSDGGDTLDAKVRPIGLVLYMTTNADTDA